MFSFKKQTVLMSLILANPFCVDAMEKPEKSTVLIQNEEVAKQLMSNYKKRLQKMLKLTNEDLQQDFIKLLGLIAPFIQDENIKKAILNEYKPFLNELKIDYKKTRGYHETSNYICALVAYALITNEESDMQTAYSTNEMNQGLMLMEYVIDEFSRALKKKDPATIGSESENNENELPMMENKIINPIEDYHGNKLLLCAGRPDFEKISKTLNSYYNQTNEQWYTVDYDEIMNPDMQADLKNPQTYDYLGRMKFNIVFSENCPHEIDNAVRKNTAPLLNSSGILVSKYCGKFRDLEKVKEEMTQAGFNQVIFGEGGDYWMKYVDPKEIISTFQRTERKESYPRGVKLCEKNDGSKGQFYSFVAIKG